MIGEEKLLRELRRIEELLEPIGGFSNPAPAIEDAQDALVVVRDLIRRLSEPPASGYRGPGTYELEDRVIEVHGAAVEWDDRPQRSVVLIVDGTFPPGGRYWFLATSEFEEQGWRYLRPLGRR
jgi:hypothetical protein